MTQSLTAELFARRCFPEVVALVVEIIAEILGTQGPVAGDQSFDTAAIDPAGFRLILGDVVWRIAIG